MEVYDNRIPNYWIAYSDHVSLNLFGRKMVKWTVSFQQGDP
jgi:hypothetical protein